MPLLKCQHLVPLSECTTTTLSTYAHNIVDGDTRYLYAWIDHEKQAFQRP